MDPTEVLDRFPFADRFARVNRGLSREDCIPIRGPDFKGAVGEVDVDVFSQMALEMLFFVFRAELAQVLGDSGEEKELGVGGGGVAGVDEVAAEDVGCGFFGNAAGGVVGGV